MFDQLLEQYFRICEQNNQMTMNQQAQRRVQYQNLQKASFISVGHKTEYAPTDSHYRNYVDDRQFFDSNAKISNKAKDNQEKGFKNLFVEDTESTKHFSKRQNYLSTQNLRVSFKGLLSQGKNVRQSQNIHTSDNFKTPPNSVNQRKISITKSASNLVPKTNQQFLVIKTQLADKGLQNQQIKQLIKKIHELEQFNEKIKEENVHLRYKKLQSGKQSVELLAIKIKINQVIRDIQKIKYEDGGRKEYKNKDLSVSKKYVQGTKDPMMTPNIYYYNTPPQMKTRNSEAEQRNSNNIGKTTSSLYFSSPYSTANNHAASNNQLQTKGPSTQLSPSLTKSRAEQTSNSLIKKTSKLKHQQVKHPTMSAHEQGGGRRASGFEFNSPYTVYTKK